MRCFAWRALLEYVSEGQGKLSLGRLTTVQPYNDSVNSTAVRVLLTALTTVLSTVNCWQLTMNSTVDCCLTTVQLQPYDAHNSTLLLTRPHEISKELNLHVATHTLLEAICSSFKNYINCLCKQQCFFSSWNWISFLPPFNPNPNLSSVCDSHNILSVHIYIANCQSCKIIIILNHDCRHCHHHHRHH